jgi:hypothetical protein
MFARETASCRLERGHVWLTVMTGSLRIVASRLALGRTEADDKVASARTAVKGVDSMIPKE